MDELKKYFLLKSLGIVVIHLILLSLMFPRWISQTMGMALDGMPLIFLVFIIIFIFISSLILLREKDYTSQKYNKGILLSYISYVPLVGFLLISSKLNEGNSPSIAPLIIAFLFILPWFNLTIVSWVFLIKEFFKKDNKVR
jgi:hypothetical protein